ncbi:hypothetical protein BB561_005473 [Smittium simulii]|uniref:CCHC-type domain-containing protein n=1 Tax=Smittium simulii TaxID=133385 RepID=A0A2T9YA74_9FUNG|nr:hypothetical protein BB561_005473 [Smittium simulii]
MAQSLKVLKKYALETPKIKFMRWRQFSGHINPVIGYVSSFIDDIYTSVQYDAHPVVVDEINKIFSSYGIIIDFSAFKNKNTSLSHTYGIKFLFKKNTEEFKIPEFIDIDDEKIALTYRGCVAACSYCKKVGHWRTECPEIKKNKDIRSKYQSNKSQKTTYGDNNTKNNNQNIFGLAPSSILDTKINNLFLDVQNNIDKKNGKKKLKLAQKSLNEFQNFQNFIESPTNDRTGDRTNAWTQDGTNIVGKNRFGTEVQPVVQRYDTPSEPNRVQPDPDIDLDASDIDFGSDYICPSSPPVVEMMDSNDGTVDGSKKNSKNNPIVK